MARRRRESTAVMRGSPPLIVREVDPVDLHPSLGPLRAAKLKRALRLASRKRDKVKAKIKVEVDVKSGEGADNA